MMINNPFNIKRRNTPLASMIILVVCLMFYGLTTRAQPQMLIVIANPKGVPNDLKFSELKSVLMGERQRWKNRTRVSAAIMKPNTQLGKNTLRTIYKMSSNELMDYQISQLNQGKEFPKMCKTTAELIEFVTENPGAIGIIDQPIENSEGLKTVKIDGKTQISVLLFLLMNSGMQTLACL